MVKLLQIAVATFLLGTLVSTSQATTGSDDVVAYDVRLPAARRDPVSVINEFRNVEPNSDRLVAFMLLMTLGREERITRNEFQAITDEGLVDVNPRIRMYAIHYIHDVHDDVTFQKLCRQYTLDKNSSVRYNAAEQLRDWPSVESLRYIEALLGDESLSVRDRASGTLLTWHSVYKFQNIREVFDRAVRSDDLRRAGCGARVLASTFDARPRIDILNNYLRQEIVNKDSDADNVRAIIRLLGNIGDSSSRDVLEEATKHSNRYVVATAREALQGGSRLFQPINSGGRTIR